MFITNSSAKLHNQLDPIRFQGGRRQCVSLVTVHSGLHDGHGAVINAAKTVSDILVVAILPRRRTSNAQGNVVTATEFHDISYIEQHTAQVLYKPEEDDLFPIDEESMVHIIKPERSLAADFDPNVLLTYLKILNVVQPDVMVWGEKKYTEFAYVRRLIAELDIRTQVQCIPTVRHANGIPVGREDDRLLSDDLLPVIHQTLSNAAHAIRSGARNYDSVARTARLPLKGAGFDIDYFQVFDEKTLCQPHQTQRRIESRPALQLTVSPIAIVWA